MTIKELREQRAKLIKDARVLIDLAEKEKREMTTEEDAQYTTMFNSADQLRSKIEREERQLENDRSILEAAELEAETRGNPGGDEGLETAQNAALMATYRSYLNTGIADGDAVEEFRALSAGVDTEGGFVVVPPVMMQGLIQGLDNALFVRELATVIPLLNGASLGAASLDNDPDDADWTTELDTGTEDTSMGFGKRELKPNPMAKLIKVSNQLMRTGAMPIDQIVEARFLFKFAETMEKAYLTGDGNLKPLGLFVASNAGIPVSRDVSEDNGATAPTLDGLKSAKFSLKAGYLQNSNWLFHRDGVKIISKLKDGDGQYLWEDSNKAGEPDILLGRPVRMSEYVPNTFTTGQYVGLIGDFSHYWILDSMQFQIQRLQELYARTNQTGFIGRYEGDGAPVLAEAFSRVTLT